MTKIFDYIIIGAGTAGSILANKLSQDGCTSVLVLEAGTNLVEEESTPSIIEARDMATNNKFSDQVLSNEEPQTGNRQFILWSGRQIGGSSSHNFFLAVRGSRELYDSWIPFGGEQWSYNHLLPLFKENESYTGNSQDPESRGRRGPLSIRQQILPKENDCCSCNSTPSCPDDSTNPCPLSCILAQATSNAANLGHCIVKEDYNTGINNVSFTRSQYMQKQIGVDPDTGCPQFIRQSAATAYLNKTVVTQGTDEEPDEFGINRKLVILTKSLVNKVLLKKVNGQVIAHGVSFVRNGVTEKAFARKCVIVSAGNFSSSVLQRSGIGRLEDLQAAGIKQKVRNDQVGHNLQSQYYVDFGIQICGSITRLNPIFLTPPGNCEPVALIYGGFLTQDAIKGTTGSSVQSRRLQILTNPGAEYIPVAEALVNPIYTFDPARDNNVMSIALCDLKPSSRGSIVVSTSNPAVYPTLHFNLFENEDDLNYVVAAYRFMSKIVAEANELDGLNEGESCPNPERYTIVYPPNLDQLTDEELKRYARASVSMLAHYAGTCRMAPSRDNGVVDGNLSVFGVKNLKVADLSVAPVVPDGNPALGAMVIGQKAFEIIQKEERERRCDCDCCDW